jgi:hypothetical protein
LVQKIQRLIPDYMVMGERGMYDMKDMPMELPPNTFPMMAGQGQFGPIGMGGMFTLLKVRADQQPNDYTDPGDYAHPPGTVAFEYNGPMPDSLRAPQSTGHEGHSTSPTHTTRPQVRKPQGHSHH